jgi:hypothetical protein
MRKFMKKLILTLLIALTLTSIASANESFQLTKAPTLNSNLAKNISFQVNDLGSCTSYCDDEFDYCLASGVNSNVCANEYANCMTDCYYDNL